LRPLKLCIYSSHSPLTEEEQLAASGFAWEKLSDFLTHEAQPFFGGIELNAVDIVLATFLRKAEGAHACDGKILLPEKDSRAGRYLAAIREHAIVKDVCGTTESIAAGIAQFRGVKGANERHWTNFLPGAFD
jgi:hypothetical protein